MQQIVECVMNVSEGRDTLKLETIARKIEAVPSAFLLDHSADPDHHRTVFSFIGTPSSIFDASFAAVKKAGQLIDMREHQGVHPRIGSVDVVPFVPVQNVSMKECVAVAHRLGKKISQTLQIPVYFYAEAALSPDREHLSGIRKDQFEGLHLRIKSDPRRKPDLGPGCLHPTAGATAIGARQPLIAFNIYLNTSDVGQAREIAGLIRESGGGLAGVKALGFYIERKGLVQVSMNVTHYRKTSLLTIFKKVQKEARRLQTEPVWSEIVGLVPQDAINPRTIRILHLKNFHSGQILENRIADVMNHASRFGGT